MDTNGKENQCRTINNSQETATTKLQKIRLLDQHLQRENIVEKALKERSNRDEKNLSILKESAVRAIAEKQDLIECLRSRLSVQQQNQTNQRKVDMEDMQNKILILMSEKEQSQNQIKNQILQHNRMKQRWEEEYDRLIWQKESLQEIIQKYQIENQELKTRVSETNAQYNQICEAYKYLLNDYRANNNNSLPKNIDLQKNELLQQKRLKILELSDQKQQLSLFHQNQFDQLSFQDSENPHKSRVLTDRNRESRGYQFEEQWQAKRNSCENSSIAPTKHCLEASLKAIHLVQNFSIQPKQRCFDTQSQFTTKYFSYDNQIQINQNDNLAALGGFQSYNNIQEDPEELIQEISNQEPHKENVSNAASNKQKVLWGFGGAVVGALMVLIFKH